MVIHRLETTAETFEQFVNLPENAEKTFELIVGEIVEVPSNPFASSIGAKFIIELGIFNKNHQLRYHITGEAGGYMIAGERYAPDVALLDKTRQPQLAKEGYNPNPPDLAVEIEYPTTVQSERRLRTKILNYLSVGTTVWVVYPETHEIEVYSPGKPGLILSMDDTLDGGDVLPGFTLIVQTIFED